MPAEEWEQLGSESAFEHPHYRVRRDTVRLPGGRVVDDYLVGELADYSVVVAVTAHREVVLVRQWKQGVGRITLELPGGVIDRARRQPLRRPASSERRRASSRPCSSSWPRSTSTHRRLRIRVTCSTRGTPNARHEPEPHEMESPDVVLVGFPDIRGLIARGTIRGAASVAGLLLDRSTGRRDG